MIAIYCDRYGFMKPLALSCTMLLLAGVSAQAQIIDLQTPLSWSGALVTGDIINDVGIIVGTESYIIYAPVIWYGEGQTYIYLQNPFVLGGSIPIALGSHNDDVLLYGITPSDGFGCLEQPCNSITNWDLYHPNSSPYSLHDQYQDGWEALWPDDPAVPSCFFDFFPNFVRPVDVNSGSSLCGGIELSTGTSNLDGWYIENYGGNSCTPEFGEPQPCGARLHIPEQTPEPSSITLLMISIGALSFITWRRRRNLTGSRFLNSAGARSPVGRVAP